MNVLRRVQNLPITQDQAWDFFSSPSNLKIITPTYMGFDISSDIDSDRMYQGMIITYKVKPLIGIPLNWVTEITHVRHPYFFVDNQKSGPFKYWHHQHFFDEISGGVQMTDIVNYAVPGAFIGRIIENFIVKKRVNEIFSFRYTKLVEILGEF